MMTVLRYVLQNPVRAGLSGTVREWHWSSLKSLQLVDRWPVGEECEWLEQLDEPMREQQLVAVRECLNRQRPFGKTDWQAEMASMLDWKVPCVRVAGRGAKRKVACPLYKIAAKRKFKVRMYAGAKIKQAFSKSGTSTKQEIALDIVNRFPEPLDRHTIRGFVLTAGIRKKSGLDFYLIGQLRVFH